jgi:hypothetical protein
MDPFSKQVSEKNAQRRSQRLVISIPVFISFRAPNNKVVSEQTKTLAINAHGALVLVAMKVSAGDVVTLCNELTDEEQQCHVVYLGPEQLEKREIGIEFVKPSPRFWRTAFPPPDWTSEHEDAKGLAQRSPPEQKVTQKR